LKEDNINKHHVEPVTNFNRIKKADQDSDITITPYLETVLEDFAL
jgi:hypothetical protein